MQKTMTETELKAEFRYRYEEYLGNLCVWGEPTPVQHDLAIQAAELALVKLRIDNGPVQILRELSLNL